MEILPLTRGAEGGWDEYVAGSAKATFFHQLGWKRVVERTYGLKPAYLTAAEGSEIVGVLPLFLMESRVLGNRLISLPYAPYGGILANDSGVEQRIFGELKALAGGLGARRIELRNLDLQDLEGSVDRSYFTLVLDLARDEASLWAGLRKSMRRYVKKSMENKLEVIPSSGDARDFYTLYSRHMRDLGSPVHGYGFFRNILGEFPSHARIATVAVDDEPAASIFLMKFRDTMIYGWGAASDGHLPLFPNYRLFWETITSCAGSGVRRFDFGRSTPDEGTYAFKAGWGAEPRQLYYQHYPAGSGHGEIRKTSLKRRVFTGIWKRVPLPLANALGPSLRRKIS